FFFGGAALRVGVGLGGGVGLSVGDGDADGLDDAESTGTAAVSGGSATFGEWPPDSPIMAAATTTTTDADTTPAATIRARELDKMAKTPPPMPVRRRPYRPARCRGCPPGV